MSLSTMPSCVSTNVPLAPRTTLGVGGAAEFYAEVSDQATLLSVVRWAKECGHKVTILGEGSNVLVSDSGVRGLVLRPHFTGIECTQEGDMVSCTVGAGVILDDVIEAVVAKDLWGIENLSAIPGTVGATPVQNVGAYGVEVKDVISTVHVFDYTTETFFELTNEACALGYRDSIFKSEKGKNFIITHVTFLLSETPDRKISYADLAQYFEGNETPTLREIRNAIIAIRSRKFPDWKVVGTAGSFFKNPRVTNDVYQTLVQKYHDIPGYITDTGMVKIPLGWVLDKVCGLKGYREGDVGLFEQQALVLVCTKGIAAREVENFSQKIIAHVFEKTGIAIEKEVTCI